MVDPREAAGPASGFVSLKRQVEAELKAQADERRGRRLSRRGPGGRSSRRSWSGFPKIGREGYVQDGCAARGLQAEAVEQAKRNREFDERIARNQAEREEVDKLMAANRARRQKAQAEHDEWKMKFEAAERRRKADQEFALQEAFKQQRAELWEHRAQKEREDFKRSAVDAEKALKKKLWKEETDRISLDKEMRMKKASYRAPLAYDIEPVGKRFEKSKPFRRIKEALKQRESQSGHRRRDPCRVSADYLGKYNTRSPSAAGMSRSGTAFDRAPTFGMTGAAR